MNLRFFPSRRIALYLARLFLLRSLAVLAGLVVILQTLDLLGESGKILAYAGNGDAEVWRYVSLRLPQLIARFLPFAVLLGTLIALAGLNQNSEIISMKAAGISAHQIIAPLMLKNVIISGQSAGTVSVCTSPGGSNTKLPSSAVQSCSRYFQRPRMT